MLNFSSNASLYELLGFDSRFCRHWLVTSSEPLGDASYIELSIHLGFLVIDLVGPLTRGGGVSLLLARLALRRGRLTTGLLRHDEVCGVGVESLKMRVEVIGGFKLMSLISGRGVIYGGMTKTGLAGEGRLTSSPWVNAVIGP